MRINQERDTESDEWIAIYISDSADKSERNNAARQLFLKHKEKVFRQVKRKIQHGDAQNDVSQEVWMNILNVDRLRDKYQAQGKFGAYLYQYTDWKISEFIRKDPRFLSDEDFKDDNLCHVDTAPNHDEVLDARSMVINVIPELSAAVRLVYLMEYYEMLFPSKPGLDDIAHLNGVGVEDVSSTVMRCEGMDSRKMSEIDRCLWVLYDYEKIVPPAVRRKVSGYKADLAKIIGISYSSYRVRLSRANELVKTRIEDLVTDQGVVA